MNRTIKFLLLISCACVFSKQDYSAPNIHEAKDFTPESILDFVNSRHIQKVEDFLNHPDLPAAYKKNFLPLKEAITLQPAALDCPRVLSYGETSSLVYSFNCGELSSEEEPGLPNNHIEMVFHNKSLGQTQTYSLNFASYSVEMHGPNPELCQECHTENDKPHIRGLDDQAFNDQEWNNFNELLQKYPKNPRYLRYKSLDWEQPNTYSRLLDLIQVEWGL